MPVGVQPNNIFEDFYPTEDELNLIAERKISNSKVNREDGISLEVKAANSLRVDRGGDLFEDKALESMAAKAIQNKIPALLASYADPKDHSWKAVNAKGIVYDAYVKDHTLYYKTWFPLTTSNKSFAEDLVKGLFKKVSVGFAIAPQDYHCSACNLPIIDKTCPHEPGINGIHTIIKDSKDNFEFSFVAVPMVEDAETLSKGVNLMETETKAADIDLNDVTITMNDNAEKEATTEPIEEPSLLDAVKSFQSQLSNIEQTLTEKMENVLKNFSIDKITNDTIQDNSLMEQETKTEENQVAVTEVSAAETKDDSVDLDGDKASVKALHDKVDALHESVKALHESMGAMCTKMDSFVLGTGQKAAEKPSDAEDDKEPDDDEDDKKKSVEQEAVKPVVADSERSTKSLDERVSDQVVEQKSANDLLWERLTLKQ